MSFRSQVSTPAVVESPKATSPKYSLSGVENEINASKNRKGYLSTLFGRSETGVANPYSMRNRRSIPSLFGDNRTE